jgi:hypothetical protein
MRSIDSLGLPSGFVPRVEKTSRQLSILGAAQSLQWVMFDLDVAERFVREGRTASQVFPRGRVITTSTIHDSRLKRYHPERELEVVEAFRPAWHIPCDRPVYVEENPEGRAWFIDSMVEGTLFQRDRLKGAGVGLLPLIKGINPDEWLRSHTPLARDGFSRFAFYVKQYFGAGVGKRDGKMVEDLRGVVSTCSPQYILLVGYQSFVRIPQLPTAVRAFAGQHWRSVCKLGHVAPTTSRRLLESLVETSLTSRTLRQEVLPQGSGIAPIEVP